MDIQLFQSFLLVAKLSNITQAAEQLNFTQPAVTAQIRTLDFLGWILERQGVRNAVYFKSACRKRGDNSAASPR